MGKRMWQRPYLKETLLEGLPGWLSRKKATCNAGDTRDSGSIPGCGRSSGGGRGNPLQCSCLENPRDRYMYMIKKKKLMKNARSTDSRGPVNPR